MLLKFTGSLNFSAIIQYPWSKIALHFIFNFCRYHLIQHFCFLSGQFLQIDFILLILHACDGARLCMMERPRKRVSENEGTHSIEQLRSTTMYHSLIFFFFE